MYVYNVVQMYKEKDYDETTASIPERFGDRNPAAFVEPA
jgi:hypothetical protein